MNAKTKQHFNSVIIVCDRIEFIMKTTDTTEGSIFSQLVIEYVNLNEMLHTKLIDLTVTMCYLNILDGCKEKLLFFPLQFLLLTDFNYKLIAHNKNCNDKK